VAADRAGDAAPQGGVLDSGPSQDLGHLGDVAEHVGQVADRHGAAEFRPRPPAHLEVAHDGLAGAEELVEQDEPGPIASCPRATRAATRLRFSGRISR